MVAGAQPRRLTVLVGYFTYNNANLGGLQTFFGQLWKEYALSDSRYLTQNTFVFCVEAMTAVSFALTLFLVHSVAAA